MSDLPVGSVTFLFTDIEGSTKLLGELGARQYGELLARHNRLLRGAFEGHGGVGIRSLGDGLFAVFRDAAAAVAAAAQAQRALALERWPGRAAVRVRMGLHTGEAMLGGDGYVGFAVHQAARIGDMGHGGQVLVSAASAALVEHAIPDGVRLLDLGEMPVADVGRRERLFQLVVDGLQSEFPPLRVKRRQTLAPSSDSLLERDAELAALSELITAAASGSGRFGLILGEAGIGKTSLVREARAAARDRGLDLLFARGGELEHEFSYGIVRQLFEPRVAAASTEAGSPLLTGAAALAAPLFTDSASASAASAPVDTSFAMLHGLYWLTANLARRGPVALVIDDLHWADEPSLRWLGFLARRIQDLPVLVIAGLRPPEQGIEQELLAELVADEAARVIRPGRLTREASDSLVRQVLSLQAEEAFCAACHEASGGNPLLLRALLDALASERVPPRNAHAGRVYAIGPEAVGRAVKLRLSRLPPGAEPLARAVAVLGEDAELPLAAALAGLDRDVAGHAAKALARSGVFRVDWKLGFSHPVMRAAVYNELSLSEREQAHAQAARRLAEAGSPPERAAAHLLLTGPLGEGFVVTVLRDAAAASLRRGDPGGATSYLRRALREAPAGEPGTDTAGATRKDLLVELGRAERLVASPAAAESLREAHELEPDRCRRGEIALELGTALFFSQRVEEAVAVLEGAIAEVGEEDRSLRLRLEAGLLGVTSIFPPLYPLAQTQLERIGRMTLENDPASRALMAIMSYDDARRLAPRDGAVARARQALSGPLWAEDNAAFVYAIYPIILADHFDEGYAIYEKAFADARVRGSISAYAIASTFRPFLELHTGRLADAVADARNGLEACLEYGLLAAVPYAAAHVADASMELGDLEGAEAVLARLDASGDGSHLVWAFLDSRGRLRLLQGRPREGLADVLEAARQYEALQGRNPALLAWRSTAALAHLELEDAVEARRLALEEVALAREWGTPRALARALRVAGAVEQEREAKLALLREAVAVVDGSPARLERAKALVELGAALAQETRSRVEARRLLREAVEAAHACGAAPVEERASRHLSVAGGRTRPARATGVDALTPGERRVAVMAAGGLTSEEIAQALFVTGATVEEHLRTAERKLGTRTRTGLARAVARWGRAGSSARPGAAAAWSADPPAAGSDVR